MCGGDADRRSPPEETAATEASAGSTVAVTAANLLRGRVLLLPISSSSSLPRGADLERFFFSVHFLTSSSTIWGGIQARFMTESAYLKFRIDPKLPSKFPFSFGVTR